MRSDKNLFPVLLSQSLFQTGKRKIKCPFFYYGELGKNDFGFNVFIAHVGNFCGPIFKFLEDETWYHATLFSSLC